MGWRQAVVGLVGPAFVVELEYRLRIGFPSPGRGYGLNRILTPIATHVAEGSQPALGTDPGTSKHDNLFAHEFHLVAGSRSFAKAGELAGTLDESRGGMHSVQLLDMVARKPSMTERSRPGSQAERAT